MIDPETENRWAQYRQANEVGAAVRRIELGRFFSTLAAQEGQEIWEFGTGGGSVTYPVAEAVGETGHVVTTDVYQGSIDAVNTEKRKRFLPITAKILSADNPVLGAEYDNKFDAVASMATFHHLDNRNEGTGESGRIKVLEAFHKALRPGGKVVIADPVHDTPTQEFFDAIDTPEHCHPDGHPHDFFTKDRLRTVVQQAGFRVVSLEVVSTPWKFTSQEQAKMFIHTAHNATCDPQVSLDLAKEILGLEKQEDGYELGWQLFYLTAQKSHNGLAKV